MEAINNAGSMQVFKHISDIITDGDFNIAIQEFFNTNCQKFEDQEENKHEYQQIYEEYLDITEKVIETKLKEDHGIDDDKIRGFYESLILNKDPYEAENSDTFDALFAMIDFEEFKKRMFDAKKGMVNKVVKDSEAGREQAYTKGLIDDQWNIYQAYMAEDLTSKEIGWKTKVNQKVFKKGYKCTVHQRKQKDKNIDLLRIDAEFQNCTVDQVLDCFINMPTDNQVTEYKTLEECADGSIIKYYRVKLPMMTDRDNVIQIFTEKKDGGVFLTIKSVEYAAMPPVKNVIRMFNYVSCMLKQEGDNVIFTDIEHFDIKGYMPSSLLNMTIASETAKGLASQMKHIYARQKV